MCAGQVEFLAKEVGEMGPGLDVHADGDPVHVHVASVHCGLACSIARRSATTCVFLSRGSTMPAFSRIASTAPPLKSSLRRLVRPVPMTLAASAMTTGRVSVAPI